MVVIEEIIESDSDEQVVEEVIDQRSDQGGTSHTAEKDEQKDHDWVKVDHSEAINDTKDDEQEANKSNLEPQQAADAEAEDPAVTKEKLERAEALKQEGNALFGAEDFEQAIDKYTESIEAAPSTASERAVYYGNRAACHLKLANPEDAITDCTTALEIQPEYIKVLLRRSTAFEALEDLERALSDAQKVKELDPKNTIAVASIARLEPIVNENREKMKEEMMGKLKELGNMFLGKFGMSVDNFKTEKDPDTGAYSIKYAQ